MVLPNHDSIVVNQNLEIIKKYYPEMLKDWTFSKSLVQQIPQIVIH